MLFWILRNEPWLHVYLGGSTYTPSYFENYPCQSVPKYLDEFYLLKLAYHFYEFVATLLLHFKRKDFPEYILHHFVTLVLISFAYCFNYYAIGAITMLAHDFSDIFVSICKLCIDVTRPSTTWLSYLLMVVTWVYFRLWFFPKHIIYEYYLQTNESTHYIISTILTITICFLMILEVLHLWWFVFMMQSLKRRLLNPEKITLKSS